MTRTDDKEIEVLPVISASQATSLPLARRRAIEAFYGALATGSFDVLDDVLTDDWDDVPLAPGQPAGPAGIKLIFAMLREAFPDITIEILDTLVDGDRAACRLLATATHRGTLFGVAASGRQVRFALHEFHEFEGDRIRRTHHMEDLFGLFGQIGVWPEIAAGAA